MSAFLLSEVAPALEAKKALQFRVLIAANLASVVANENRSEIERFNAETARLAALLKVPVPSALDATERSAAVEHMNRQLITGLRDGSIDFAAALTHLRATARETLAVTNPRFDPSDELNQ
ncbi:MAG: hypothetical protein JNG84_10140 [Archangium sp.]|nr:hypothetical protein [Archangium sp.]